MKLKTLKAEKEKLTPVYVVQVASRVSGGIFHKEQRDEFGDNGAVPVGEVEARKIVSRYEKKGVGARVYQYGWKQRGYREGESQCQELCHNSFWNGWHSE